jgi:hypothetical protein
MSLQIPILIQKDDKTIIEEEKNIDTDSDEEDKNKNIEINPKNIGNNESKLVTPGARQPDVPFHMNLRERKVRFT